MKKTVFFLISTLFILNVIGQQRKYATGLILDEKSYDAMPRKARLTDKAYFGAPTSSSLKTYCPEIGDQGGDGTCVGWSTAWAMRTIIDAKQKNMTNTAQITKMAYSPAFNYYFSTDRENFSCTRGAFISDAISSMINRGVPRYIDFPGSCSASVPSNLLEKAKAGKLKDGNRLYDSDASNEIKISSMKTALGNGNPVAFGMLLPSSFFSAKGCWMPGASEEAVGAHAMCAIGYDNSKYGGAIEIMNSWGSAWGNDGFMWIKYEDFAKYVRYAFEAYPEKGTPQGTTIAGTVKLLSYSGSEMQVGKNNDPKLKATTVDEVGIGDYVANQPLTSGSRYRLLVTANQEIYVYVVSSDLNNTVNQLFPATSESALLSYTNNEIALPGERKWILLDNTKGKEFTCVIYSTKELNVNSIVSKIRSASGSFVEKVNYALGSDLIPKSSMTLATDRIKFEAKANDKKVSAIIIEINHI